MHRHFRWSHACLVTALAAALPCAQALPSKPANPGHQAPYRNAPSQLPSGVVPQHYRIHLTPDAGNLQFSAHVEIDLAILKPTRSLTLHAVDMQFERAEVASGGAATTTLNAPAQTATFTFDRMLPVGRQTLVLDYKGKIYKQASGLFALDYETSNGRRRALYTQFEAADARRVIPSWDEPNFKARFEMSATVPADQMAVSNMPLASTTPLGNGLHTVRFQTSPTMSTYLLSFNVGDFERSSEQLGATELGIVTRTGELAKAEWAREAARQALTWYNDYFDLPYPLPKLDHIAAPGQSQFFGAMENWGSIFYFEQSFLLDPGFATQRDRQSIFGTVAHETAHQWFGNLVTMAWWDDLWLNEGFASWLARRTSEKFHPQWNTHLNAVGAREWAMQGDALATSHAVVQKVHTVQQAAQAFDGITYSKGEAILRMLEGYVGETAWRDGIRSYLKRHAYGNAVTQDLWRAVESVAGKPIRAIAHDFTRQPGVPLITVGNNPCVNGKTLLTLTQGEFAPDRPGKTPRRWRVPVSVKLVESGQRVQALVRDGTANLVLPGCGALLVNDGQTGYFRTAYGPAALLDLTARYAGLDAIDQLGLLRDSWALGLGGARSPADALALVYALSAEGAPQVWAAALDIVREVDRLNRGQPTAQAQWRGWAIPRLQPLLQRLGWLAREGESGPTATLRNDVISTLGILGDATVIAQARQRRADELQNVNAVPAPLRRTIYGVLARHADAAQWTQLRAAANAEKNAQWRAQLFTLLGAADDPALARQALELALTDEPGDTTSPAMLRRVAVNHPDMAWEFAQEHLPAVLEKLLQSDRAGFIPELASGSHDPAMVQKIRNYAHTHIAADARRPAEESVGEIQERIRIRTTKLPLITDWLRGR